MFLIFYVFGLYPVFNEKRERWCVSHIHAHLHWAFALGIGICIAEFWGIFSSGR
ncbi:hypothetical protein BDW02DRAFT_526895 [Decorospora gaudefroyi]|uniref:Uncharacterized protein n=1 Tax=Decorospora gaudefroyi TaxID=184978 RepID=A0A6A5KEX3_9PLEO|nr:hypothetical protein BDW02DRAFT_526895 [Decorospora gaudefroyi]